MRFSESENYPITDFFLLCHKLHRDRFKMAGECLSYGAFGAYSTLYGRSNTFSSDSQHQQHRNRRVDSWKNYLSDGRRYKTPTEEIEVRTGSSPTNNKDDNHYDHVAHAGLQGI